MNAKSHPPQQKTYKPTACDELAKKHRAEANDWSDEKRAELDSRVMAFFYGKRERTKATAHSR